MLAALLAFRVIYYLLPLLLAAVLLGVNEVAMSRETLRRVWGGVGRWFATVSPSLLGLGTLIAGTVMLLSGAVPIFHGRLAVVRDWFPLPLVELSHFLASLTGAGLLLLAMGLYRRLDSAFWVTVGLLAAGIVFALLKGLVFEEAMFLGVILTALLFCRREFYRKGSLLHEPFTPGWVGGVVLALGCSVWLGVFAHKHLEYSSDLWWSFAFHGDAPRFLRATVGAVSVFLLFGMWKLLAPSAPRPAPPEPADLETVAGLVSRVKRTWANLALLGDKSFLFNDQRTAFLMYAVKGRSWVALGDPVGPDEEAAELVWRFRTLCDRYDGWPVFYQVETDHLPIYLDQGLTLLKLGEEARVPLEDFSLEGSTHKGLRKTHRACQRAGCVFELVAAEGVAGLLPQLRAVSEAWLSQKRRREKSFSLGFFDEAYLKRFPCAVVRHQDHIVAFASLWLGAERTECSPDLLRYLPEAPRGKMEYLFVELLLWAKQHEYEWFSLGMAPLSGIEDRPLAPLWNRATGLVYRHGEHFYSFAGLRHYKEKFCPVWFPRYLASPGGLALPQILADITALISRGAP
jgi:phosphatidylglycerol lysyltransferase